MIVAAHGLQRFRSATAVWGVAAVQVIVKEAGRFTNLAGVPRPDGGSAVSTNGLLHDQVLGILRAGQFSTRSTRGLACKQALIIIRAGASPLEAARPCWGAERRYGPVPVRNDFSSRLTSGTTKQLSGFPVDTKSVPRTPNRPPGAPWMLRSRGCRACRNRLHHPPGERQAAEVPRRPNYFSPENFSVGK
jgi:hypothetical protein